MVSTNKIKEIFTPAVAFIKFRILHVDDSPHRIAFGVAIGLFLAFQPPLGFHMIAAVVLAYILSANKFVALTCIWANNPFTLVLIYYPNYVIGRAVLGFFHTNARLEPSQVTTLVEETSTFWRFITSFHTREFWQELGELFLQIGLEITVGGLILGAIIAAAAYFATRKLIRRHRMNIQK